MRLNKTNVEGLGRPETTTFTWDDTLSGFGLRTTQTGIKSYIVQARVNGKTRRVTLGRHGTISADQARKRAKQVLGTMSSGLDPAVEKRRRKAEEKRAKVLSITLREVMESYLRDRPDLKPRSQKDIRYHVDHSFKAWANEPAAAITRDKVTQRFRKLSDTSHAQANQAFRNLRALLNYAAAQWRTPDDKPVIVENPVDVLSQSRMWHKPKARNTYVPLAEIGRWWSAVEKLRADPSLTPASITAADLVAFLTLTGLRLGEARALRWDQVIDDSMRLADTKNRTDVTLPLSKAALRILADRPEGEYVFAARSGSGHLKDCRATLEKLTEETGINVTAHDLRRTFRAVAGKCNIELWRTKALMNHRQNHDVTLANYTDLEDVRYLRPEADAIGDWIERQRQIAESDKVVSFEVRA